MSIQPSDMGNWQTNGQTSVSMPCAASQRFRFQGGRRCSTGSRGPGAAALLRVERMARRWIPPSTVIETASACTSPGITPGHDKMPPIAHPSGFGSFQNPEITKPSSGGPHRNKHTSGARRCQARQTALRCRQPSSTVLVRSVARGGRSVGSRLMREARFARSMK